MRSGIDRAEIALAGAGLVVVGILGRNGNVLKSEGFLREKLEIFAKVRARK